MKKKCMALLLAVLLTCCVATAFPASGEELDFSGMSYDELLQLRDQIDAEMATRPEYEAEPGYSGLLIGGKTIAVGAYEFVCLEDLVEIQQWTTEEEYAKDKSLQRNCLDAYYHKGDIVLVYFDSGTVMNIENSVSIRPSEQDWVPKTEE